MQARVPPHQSHHCASVGRAESEQGVGQWGSSSGPIAPPASPAPSYRAMESHAIPMSPSNFPAPSTFMTLLMALMAASSSEWHRGSSWQWSACRMQRKRTWLEGLALPQECPEGDNLWWRAQRRQARQPWRAELGKGGGKKGGTGPIPWEKGCSVQSMGPWCPEPTCDDGLDDAPFVLQSPYQHGLGWPRWGWDHGGCCWLLPRCGGLFLHCWGGAQITPWAMGLAAAPSERRTSTKAGC